MLKHILFKIVSIEENSFSIDRSVAGKPEEIDFDIEGCTQATPTNKMIDISFKVTFLLGQPSKPVLDYSATIKFYIDNFDDFVTLTDDQTLIDDFLSNKLIHITLHTIRGMLFTKTANTGLASCYLPLID